MRELLRVQREIQRFCDLVEADNPGLSARLGEFGTPQVETIRNAETTLAQIVSWIRYRQLHHRDQETP